MYFSVFTNKAHTRLYIVRSTIISPHGTRGSPARCALTVVTHMLAMDGYLIGHSSFIPWSSRTAAGTITMLGVLEGLRPLVVEA